MASFADRLIEQIRAKDSRCIVGLDPRIDQMPAFVASDPCAAITEFHELVLDAVADLVPAVKPQLAFFEQYGVAGMQAFENTVRAAKQRGLLVIADGKRNDISSTAEAYANAYLSRGGFDCDALTVTPYLGRDSLDAVCRSLQEARQRSVRGSENIQPRIEGFSKISRSSPPAGRCMKTSRAY